MRHASYRARFAVIGLLLFVVSGLVLYHMLNGTRWRYTASLEHPRYMFVSAPLSDGTLLFGAENSGDSSSDPVLEIFHPGTDSWTFLKKETEAARKLASQLPCKVWAEPENNLWGVICDDTGARFLASMDDPNRFIGNDAAECPEPLALKGGGSLSYYKGLSIRDPKTGLDSPILSPIVMDSLSPLFNVVPLPDGRIFFARESGYGQPDTTEALFDPGSKSWQLLTDENAGVGQTATLLPSGKILVIGGACRVDSLWLDLVDVWRTTRSSGSAFMFHRDPVIVSRKCRLYDPVTNRWTLTDSLNAPRAFHTTNLLPDGRILVSGGFTEAKESAMTNTCEIISLKDIDP